MGLLNDEGDVLARRVQRGLVRAGLRDVSVLAVDPRRHVSIWGGCLAFHLRLFGHGHPSARVRVGWDGEDHKRRPDSAC